LYGSPLVLHKQTTIMKREINNILRITNAN
jgi:hypothetical protein